MSPPWPKLASHVMFSPEHPVLVQADGSILLDAHHARADEAREALAPYAEIVSAPEHVHTYRLSSVSIWNALALGRGGDDVKIDVGRFSRYGIPPNVVSNIDGWVRRYGRISIERDDPDERDPAADGGLRLVFSDATLAREAASTPKVAALLGPSAGSCAFRIAPIARGEVKWALVKMGYPVEDRAGFGKAEPLAFRVRDGEGFDVRDYQRISVDAFAPRGAPHAGHGVVVLPCGAGKTLVGVLAAERVRASVLVLCTSDAAVEQWVREFRDRTDLPPDAVGRYTGRSKEVRPVTVATYSVLTVRRNGEFPNLALFSARAFGLVIYDEVHLLPAPVFRVTASLQATRRLGLTATLLREDGREDDVFALIGPKRYDVPWKTLERQNFIAEAECAEVRVAMSDAARGLYASADPVDRFRIAAENPAKTGAVQALLSRHSDRQALVLGVYVEQLRALAEAIGAPFVCGETPAAKRELLYAAFRRGEVPTLVVSRVGSFALDLPTASVGIEVSGTYGSRQEEAQRLGRILRPKNEKAHFYTVVSDDTVEVDFALRRQRFLAEQGYRYRVEMHGKPGGVA
ncbi:MAG: helicase-associated domain-containing protein [Planctomycetes bacterium]|nr:helicase-associated domain-containing protein [Planctomycetota bacterium]